MQPTEDRILLQRIQEPERLVILTDAEPSRKFKVLAVGPGKWDEEFGERRPLDVKAGDIVVLPGIAANEPDWEAEQKILVREGDIGWKIQKFGAPLSEDEPRYKFRINPKWTVISSDA